MTEKAVLKVTGMTCDGCVNAVRSIIGSVDGVENVTVNLEFERATFDYDAGQAQIDAIIKEVEDLGYGASVPEA